MKRNRKGEATIQPVQRAETDVFFFWAALKLKRLIGSLAPLHLGSRISKVLGVVPELYTGLSGDLGGFPPVFYIFHSLQGKRHAAWLRDLGNFQRLVSVTLTSSEGQAFIKFFILSKKKWKSWSSEVQNLYKNSSLQVPKYSGSPSQSEQKARDEQLFNVWNRRFRPVSIVIWDRNCSTAEILLISTQCEAPVENVPFRLDFLSYFVYIASETVRWISWLQKQGKCKIQWDSATFSPQVWGGEGKAPHKPW